MARKPLSSRRQGERTPMCHEFWNSDRMIEQPIRPLMALGGAPGRVGRFGGEDARVERWTVGPGTFHRDPTL